jgi:hypothetical protein
VKDSKSILQTNVHRMQAGVSIVITDKVDIKPKLVRKTKKVPSY